MNETVSVIVPVYNAEPYLDRCLKSILSQDWRCLDIILINDGSSDRSGNICLEYSLRDSRITYIEQENKGVSSARNTGIQAAQGSYLIFVDADDSLESNYVMSLMKNIKQYQSDMAICFVKTAKGETWQVKPGLICMDPVEEAPFLELNRSFLLYGPVNKLYKTDIIKENGVHFPKGIAYGEDLIFNLQYVRKVKKISVTDETAYFYSDDNQSSLSRKYRKDYFENGLLLHQAIKGFLDEKGLHSNQYQEFLYGRLFDVSYNAIFLEVSCAKGHYGKKYAAVKNILKNGEVQKSYKWVEFSKYGKIIPELMEKKFCLFLMLYILLGKMRNQS